MKILVVADLHMKIARQTMNIAILKWIEDVIEEQKPELIVYLGDATDSHAVLRAEIQAEFHAHLSRPTNTIPRIYMLGNHDMFKPKDSTYHAFQTFNVPNVHIIDKPTDLYGMTFVPYMPTGFPTKTKSICFAHQTFDGADYGSIRAEDGIDPNTVSADLIISGHVHKRQYVDKVIYPGSPVAYDANDIDQTKGLMILETDTLQHSYISSPFPDWYRFTYNTSEQQSEEILSDFGFYLNEKDNFILELEGYKSDINYLLESRTFTEWKNQYRIRVIPTFLDKKKETVSIKSFTVRDIVDEYIDKVYKGNIDKKELKDCLATIIEG